MVYARSPMLIAKDMLLTVNIFEKLLVLFFLNAKQDGMRAL